jgi:transcriptional/translational regulatory protein YebC/TACO1
MVRGGELGCVVSVQQHDPRCHHPHTSLSSSSLYDYSKKEKQQQHFYSTTTKATMMAGHNKWSKIRHKKGAKDVQRAKLLGKASKSLTVAVRLAGGDVDDFRVQTALLKAKDVQLSKERIQEAIQKGQGGGGGAGGKNDNYESLRFDAMIPIKPSSTAIPPAQQQQQQQQNVACIITALSDNRNRTTQNVRHIITKAGGELLPTDTLNYVFQHVGMILVVKEDDEEGDTGELTESPVSDDSSSVDWEDRLLECALEAGAINVEEEEEATGGDIDDDGDDGDDINNETVSKLRTFIVTTEERDLYQVVSALQKAKYRISQFEHRYVLLDDDHGGVALSDEAGSWERLGDILDKLDDDDDVDQVYHNATPL